jgi:general secretion pathway protein A
MYLAFYNLEQEPFRLTSDPQFLHLAEPHRRALKTLAGGVATRKGFMLFTGPVGAGKTTVLNSLLTVLARRFPDHTLRTALLVNPRMTRDELLESLLDEFEIPCAFPSKPRRLAALRHMMFSAHKAGGTALLVVDEAHLASVDFLEEIRLLANSDSYREKLLQVILCGQPEFVKVLRRPALQAIRQRIAIRAKLRGLVASETQAYIAGRLQSAGLKGPLPFALPCFDAIHRLSGGIPRLINLICDTCLEIGSDTRRFPVGQDIVEEAAVRHELNEPVLETVDNCCERTQPERDVPSFPMFSDSLKSAKPAGGRES